MARNRRRSALTIVVAVAGALLLAAPARGELAIGVLDGPGNALVTFDTSAPQQFTAVRPISGLQPGEAIVGIDYRFDPIGVGASPAGLYGLGIVDAGATDTARLYRVDQGTGAATPVGSPINNLDDGTGYGVDFTPNADRLRVVSDADENLRINPNNGARVDNVDTNLSPGAVNIEAAAYNRVDADTFTPTTLFAINATDDTLAFIGGADGIPSPNGGTVSAVGPMMVTTSALGSRNLDISRAGTAFFTATTLATGSPDLYIINLVNGAATLAGSLPSSLRAFALVPPASVQFDTAAVSVAEGATTTLPVTRSGAVSGTAAAAYEVSGATASRDDFVTAAGTVSFAPQETTKTIDVVTTDDGFDEPDETLELVLSDPDLTTALGSPATATLTIVDDDPGPSVDTKPPAVQLGDVPKSLSLKKLLKMGVPVSATRDEPAALEFLLLGSLKRAQLRAADNLTLASQSLPLGTGPGSVKLKPPRSLVGKPKKKVKLRVRVTATDAAQNSAVSSQALKVKPAK